MAQVGEAAVGDGETEQPGDDEHEGDPAPTAALGKDTDAHGGDDHVADGIGDADCLGEDAARPRRGTRCRARSSS